MRFRSGVLLASLALVACGGESGTPSGEWRATVDTVGDTITVRTLSGSVWGDTATLVAEVTIGTLDGADEYLIGDPAAIAVGADGVIYMLDRQVPVVRAYAPDGTWLRDIGREGGGPGERGHGRQAQQADGGGQAGDQKEAEATVAIREVTRKRRPARIDREAGGEQDPVEGRDTQYHGAEVDLVPEALHQPETECRHHQTAR